MCFTQTTLTLYVQGRSTSSMSKSSLRKAFKILRANTKQTSRADNKCQDQARVKAKCVRNAYSACAVRYVERQGPRKDVSAEVARKNPVCEPPLPPPYIHTYIHMLFLVTMIHTYMYILFSVTRRNGVQLRRDHLYRHSAIEGFER